MVPLEAAEVGDELDQRDVSDMNDDTVHDCNTVTVANTVTGVLEILSVTVMVTWRPAL